MLRLLYPVLVSFFVAAPATLALASQDRQVIRGAYLDFPPLAYTTEDGRAAGKFIELTNAIVANAGYDIRWQELPLSRIYLYLEHGTIDLWIGSAGVPTIAPHVVETDFQPLRIRLMAYYMNGTPPVRGLDDLLGESLILIRGYTYWNLLESHRAKGQDLITVAPGHGAGLQMLELRRGRYLIDFQHPVDEVLQHSPVAGLERSLLLEWPLTLILSRKTKNVDAVVDAFNESYRALEQHRTTERK